MKAAGCNNRQPRQEGRPQVALFIFVNNLYFFTLWGPPAHWWAGRNREFLNRRAAMRHGSQHIYTFFTLPWLSGPPGIYQISQTASPRLPLLSNLEQYVSCLTRQNKTSDRCFKNIPDTFVSRRRPPLGQSDLNLILLLPCTGKNLKSKTILMWQGGSRTTSRIHGGHGLKCFL